MESSLTSQRRPGETDDRGVMCRRYAGELRRELEAEGGVPGLVTAISRTTAVGSRYRAAVASSARNLLSYSGRGYPAAGVEAYGDELDVDGVHESDYVLARRVVDEVDVLAARKTVDEVLDVYIALDAGDEVLDVTTDRGRERIALEVSSRRRARR